MRSLINPGICVAVASLALVACARTETPEEARQAAIAAQEEYDRMAAEANGSNEEEILAAGSSPGQIDTSGSISLTPGEWSVETRDGEQMAVYGEEGDTPSITIACEVGGGIDMRLPGRPPQGGSGTINISTPEGNSTFTASEAVGDEPAAYISIPANDPFIDLLLTGDGVFSVSMNGREQVAFPGTEELAALVATCDRSDSPVAATSSGDIVTGAEAEAIQAAEGDGQ